jgi:GH35 family endo-1,4-beta-xylanase
MDQALTELATLGLPIHITELDVNSAAAANAVLARTFPTMQAALRAAL